LSAFFYWRDRRCALDMAVPLAASDSASRGNGAPIPEDFIGNHFMQIIFAVELTRQLNICIFPVSCKYRYIPQIGKMKPIKKEADKK